MNIIRKIIANSHVIAAVKTLGKAVVYATLAALGVNLVGGCSSLTPSDKTQTMSVVGIGLPAIAVITTSTQTADNTGDDTNAAKQVNPVTTVIGK